MLGPKNHTHNMFIKKVALLWLWPCAHDVHLQNFDPKTFVRSGTTFYVYIGEISLSLECH